MSHTDISLVYENSDGKEAVLTYTPETHAIYGTFEVQEIEEMGSQNFRKSKPLILNSGDRIFTLLFPISLSLQQHLLSTYFYPK